MPEPGSPAWRSSSGCQLLLDFSPLADGGPPDGVGATRGDADARSCAPRLEPNDSLGEAAGGRAAAAFGAAICPARRHDFYGFTLDGSQDLVLELTFAAGAATISSSSSYDADGAVLTLSRPASTATSGSSIRRRSATAWPPALRRARVRPRRATVQNEYQLDAVTVGAAAGRTPAPGR